MSQSTDPAAAVAAPPQAIGTCRILGEWGRWRRLTLFKARDTATDGQCLVAVPDATGAVIMNADVLAGLDHPNLVRVARVLEWEGRPVAVLESPGGDSLRRKLVREVRLGVGPALSLMAGAAGGLVAAQAGLLWHGALDPDALLVADGGDVRVLGAGLTNVVDAGPVPASEVPFRAPYYHSSGRAGDWRDDVMALGVLGYTAMIGRPPVSGARVDEVSSRLRRGRWPLVQLPETGACPRLGRLFERIAKVHLGVGIRSLTDLLVELDAARKDAAAHGLLAEDSTLTEADRIQLRMELLARAEGPPRPPTWGERVAAWVAAARERLPWSRVGLALGPAVAGLVCLAVLLPVFHGDPGRHAESLRGALPPAEAVAAWSGAADDEPGAAPEADAALARAQAFQRAFPEDRKGTEEALRRVVAAFPDTRAAHRAQTQLEALGTAPVAGAAAEDAEHVARAAATLVTWEEFATARSLWSELLAATSDTTVANRAAAAILAIERDWRERNRQLLDQARQRIRSDQLDEARARVEKVLAQPSSAVETLEAEGLLRQCGGTVGAGEKR